MIIFQHTPNVNPTQRGANEITHGTPPQNFGADVVLLQPEATKSNKSSTTNNNCERKNLSENRGLTLGLLLVWSFF
jgi:hypothetical protein